MAEYNIVAALQGIEEDLITSMRRNMKRHIGEEKDEGINWTQWQAEMLRGLREYEKENADKFLDYFSTINDEIEKTLKQAYDSGASQQEIEVLENIKRGYTASPITEAQTASFFAVNSKKLNALIKTTVSEMEKAETAVLRKSNDIYRKTIFNAQVAFNSGATTLYKAVDMATKDFMSAGINAIQYKNGNTVPISSYAEMALRTGNKRANFMGAAASREKFGIHTVEITAHNSACPLCTEWQGRVYIDDVYGSGTAAEAKEKGYELLSAAIAGGMFHPNCKNGLSTFYEGINSTPKKPTVEEVKEQKRVYQLEQRQRYTERQVRKYKRLEASSFDKADIQKYGRLKDSWSKQLNSLIKNNKELRKETERLKFISVEGNTASKIIKENIVKLKPDDIINNNGVASDNLKRFKTPDYRKFKDLGLTNTIDSLSNQVSKHKDKVNNPSKYVTEWQNYTAKHKAGLIKHWNHEIKIFNEQIDAAAAELLRRQKLK